MRRHLDVDLSGKTDAMKAYVATLEPAPARLKDLGGEPAIPGSTWRRLAFTALCNMGYVHVWMSDVIQDSWFVMSVHSPVGTWRFAMPVEMLVGAASIIAYHHSQGQENDYTFRFLGQFCYVPHDIASKFMQAVQIACDVVPERVKAHREYIHTLMKDDAPTTTTPEPAPTPVIGGGSIKLTDHALIVNGMAQQLTSYTRAFYVSVLCNIIMFFYVMQATSTVCK